MEYNSQALNEILSYLSKSKSGLVKTILKDSFNINDANEAKLYSVRLKTDGYITLKDVSGGREMAMITDEGRLFLNDGGYNTQKMEKSQNSKQATPAKQTKAEYFVNSVKDIKGTIEYKLGVMGQDELSPHLTKLDTLFENYFGATSNEYTELRSIIDADSVYSKLVPLLVKVLTRIELNTFDPGTTQNAKLSHTDSPAINRKSINYVLDQVKKIRDELPNIHAMDGHKLRGVTFNLKQLFEKVFDQEHLIFTKMPHDIITTPVLETVCNYCINELELKLLGIESDMTDLHPIVLENSEAQFKDGHYREAVLNSYIALIEHIKGKNLSPQRNGVSKDGTDLMQDVFSKDSPKILFSDDPNERQGMMFLYSGAVLGIRNKYGHKSAKITDRSYALNLLHFASALFRLADNPTIYNSSATPPAS